MDKLHLLGMVDNTDGNSYLNEHGVLSVNMTFKFYHFGIAMLKALMMLNKNDEVLILGDEDFYKHKHDFLSLAPYSIIITKGDKA